MRPISRMRHVLLAVLAIVATGVAVDLGTHPGWSIGTVRADDDDDGGGPDRDDDDGDRRSRRSPLQRLAQALKREVNRNPDFDPTGNDELAQATRATFLVKSLLPPAVLVQSPLDGQNFAEGDDVVFRLQLTNWSWQPERATNARTEYANGNNEPNIGHLHGWIYDLETGELVRFYGANLNGGVTYDPDTGMLSFTEQYEPGIYKMYFQAQNNDHTSQAVVAAPDLPAIDTVVFTVGDFSLEDLQLDP